MLELATLNCEAEGAVASVILQRPEALNAINAAMLEDLDAAFQELAGLPAIRAIVLTGAGPKAFAAGADIRELLATGSSTGEALSRRGQQVFTAIERCGKPVIAAINGFAFGGGLELAMACTLRLAADSAQMGMPEARLGLIPGFGGIQRLVRLVGRGAALRTMLTAQPLGAAEALRLGLVEEVVPADGLRSRALELAHALAALSPLALAGILETVSRQEDLSGDKGFAVEREIFGQLCGTADKHEGLEAFLQKRPPAWQGR